MADSDSSDLTLNPGHPRNEYRRRYRRKRNRKQVDLHVSDSSSEADVSASELESPHRPQNHSESEASEENRPPSPEQIMQNRGDFNQETEAEDISVESQSENEAHQEEAVNPIAPHVGSEHNESSPPDSDQDHESAPESADNSADESAESDNSNIDNVAGEDDWLFPGSPLSVGEWMLAVLLFFMRHKLTGQCLNDLLSLIALICPPDNKCIKTLYKFRKYFSMIGKSVLKFHYYCSVCERPLQVNEACQHCGEGTKVDHFLELPLIPQLQSMFQRPGFYEALQYRFNRIKKFDGNIEDIHDSNIYKDQVANGFLNNPNNICFLGYFDGISIFKSSNFSVWPVYMVISELNFKMRTKRENIIFAGVWFGVSKTNPNLFLQPLHSDLSTFESDGHLFERAEGLPILVRNKMLCCTCDLQAKCRFMRMTQWNSYFGCTYCLIRTRRYNIGGSFLHVYPYSPIINVRHNIDIPQFAEQAVRNHQYDACANVYGVKGMSLLYFLLADMIKCMAMDAMHGITGVIKLLTSLWFDASYAESPFSVHHLLNIVDERLKLLKPPSYIQLIPRSIITDIAHWKSLEYKLWFFYYSLPLLLNVLPEIYWNHHCKLVSAKALLHQQSIFPEHINIARDLLHSYLGDFSNLYGLRYMSLNVHQLIHFPDVVENLGPLFVYNCFFFKDLNGLIASLIHGTRYAAMQISSSVSAFLTLPGRLNALDPNSAVRKYGERLLTSGQTQMKIACEINPNLYVVGFFTRCDPMPPIVRDALYDGFDIQNGRCQYFQKLKKKGVVYVAESYYYRRNLQKLSSYAAIDDAGTPTLCKIKKFVKWSPCNQECLPRCEVCPSRCFAIVEIYERIPWNVHNVPNVRMLYLHRVRSIGVVRAFSVKSLSALCFYLTVDEFEYFACPVNDLETE